jgi:hypothetical protein
MGYSNPWRGTAERDCHTCRFSIGMPDGVHFWCERVSLVVVFACGFWEREGGTEQLRHGSPREFRHPAVIVEEDAPHFPA